MSNNRDDLPGNGTHSFTHLQVRTVDKRFLRKVHRPIGLRKREVLCEEFVYVYLYSVSFFVRTHICKLTQTDIFIIKS